VLKRLLQENHQMYHQRKITRYITRYSLQGKLPYMSKHRVNGMCEDAVRLNECIVYDKC
jgi:hypothetical protein